MAQPTDLQTQINSVQWTNGARAITGAFILSLFTTIFGILSGMGTWTGGVYVANINTQAVLAALGYTPAPQVASTAVLGTINLGFLPGEVIRLGFSAPGDGGRATFVHSTSACAIAGGDGGSQIVAADGGCWNVDWSSVNNVASMPLFGCFGQATDCTGALKAAVATTKNVYVPTGYYLITTGVLAVSTPGQIIYGDGRARTRLDCRLPASPGTTNPCLTIASNPALGQPAADIRDLQMLYGLLPDSATPSVTAPYGPLIYMQGQPGTRLSRLRLERASTDVDLRGNSGQSDFWDIEYNCLATCWFDDGSLDSVRWDWTHGFAWDLTANQASQFYGSATAFDIGRSDDFRISHGLWIGRLAFNFHVSNQTATAGTSALGSIDHFDCDSGSCMKVTSGQIEVTGLLSTLANAASYTANISGGVVDFSGLQIGIGGPGAVYAQPAFLVAGDGTNGVPRVTVNGGSTTYFGTQASQFDVTAFQTGTSGLTANAELSIVGHRFNTVSGTPALPTCSQNPIINKIAGRMTIVGVRMSDIGTTGGGSCPNKFINIPSDGFDRTGLNVAPGWTTTTPPSPVLGVYQ